MKYYCYKLEDMDKTKILVENVCRDYTEGKLSIMKIALKYHEGYQKIRKILIDNDVKLREGAKKD